MLSSEKQMAFVSFVYLFYIQLEDHTKLYQYVSQTRGQDLELASRRTQETKSSRSLSRGLDGTQHCIGGRRGMCLLHNNSARLSQ